MESKQARDEGDFFPFAASSGKSPNTPKEQERPGFKGSRSITPRGTLFTNLDEAHRKITSRLPSNNPYRKPSGGSQSAQDIPSQDLSTPISMPPDSGVAMMKPNHGLHQHATEIVLPLPSPQNPNRSLADRRAVKIEGPLSTHDDKNKNFAVAGSASAEDILPDDSNEFSHPGTEPSTVDKFVVQYAVGRGSRGRSLSIGSSEYHGYSYSSPRNSLQFDPYSRDGATTRLGFNDEEERNRFSRDLERGLPQWCDESEYTSSELPQIPLPHRQSVVAGDETLMQTTNVADAQGLLNANPDSNEIPPAVYDLFPQPLRIPSKDRASFQKSRPLEDVFSDADSSSIGYDPSTGSNDDPFRYDSARYRAFLKPGKERDVSQALRHVSGVGTYGEHLLKDSNANERARKGMKNSARESRDLSAPPLRSRKWLDQSEGGFFDQDTLPADQATVGKSREVKVIINHNPQPDKGKGKENHEKKEDSNFGLTIERNEQTSARLTKDATNDGDWVTEATSDIGYDRQAAPGKPLNYDIKPTGSSIADYSDNDEEAIRQGIVGSTEQILHHPSGESLSTTYRIHNVKGMPQQVMLLRTQVNRVNGFAQNSMRFKPDAGRLSGLYETPGMFQKLSKSKPFPGKPYQRADSSSYFTNKTDRTKPSKYDFRDSTSEYTVSVNDKKVNGDTYADIPSTSLASIDTEEVLNENPSGEHIGAPYQYPVDKHNQVNQKTLGDSHRNGLDFPRPDESSISRLEARQQMMYEADGKIIPFPPDSQNFGITSIGSKFSFPLLPLRDAQSLHKQRRESGETDETESAAKRKMRVYSDQSSQPNITPISLLPPSPAYLKGKSAVRRGSDFRRGSGFRRGSNVRRGSLLSTTFTPPHWVNSVEEISPLSDPSLHATPSASQAATALARYGGGEDTPAAKRGWFVQNNPRVSKLQRDKCAQQDDAENSLEMIARQGGAYRETDEYISNRVRKASKRHTIFFYGLVVLCLIPFIPPFALKGKFDNTLRHFTKGQVNRLTSDQRKFLQWMWLVQIVLIIVALTGCATYFGKP
ncbi:uncharacterized protein BCR38DRAFT_405846 [Pseudomassariella vexata]|uniref:Uncharacterized protein n=1 Tax=Pseudomassariella vexata TaxID=1141098 RepID=A0A1Y2EF91_9PEZI|nr:uncharacterized protein BCR38DRAFT_405846 [Pseudomassariella vexata]ORY70219.1 hypothetical protein BCR38DRAFT_405846 [Pseudomassariella vexata]